MTLELVIPTFIAGVLTFLAPCTLPLVPGYLGFLAGGTHDRKKIFLNGLMYVIGFSAIFILFGTLAGLAGAQLAQYRAILGRAGGVFIILFGLFMIGVLKLPGLQWLQGEHRFGLGKYIKPGHPGSSLLFGAAFAVGWTPCVGPVLGAVLTLAATSTTAASGAILLTVFSAGLAVPFLLVAAGLGQATRVINNISVYLNWISKIGGAFLIFIGILLLTNTLGIWVSFFFRLFGFVEYEGILDYL